ncbi:ABC transporter permease [Helicobacter sp. 13S00477-4]|uniref:ABC transporter permease n=1 Tax=Helicobacter sp. 13S00477-4 TaxID=1905759 RepID=UPI000BA5EEBF|nr:ABC transporter permease [Helicobacter sp. 13S00477-4]PAF52254.1 ABC transporter [Helicobacter sp. 13S00477-4]
MSKTSLSIQKDTQKTIIYLGGHWDFRTDIEHLNQLKTALKNSHLPLGIDFSDVTHIDFVFSCFLIDIFRNYSLNVEFINISDKIQRILGTIRSYVPKENAEYKQTKKFGNIFEKIGRWVESFFQKTLDFFNFMGITLYFFGQTLIHPSRIRIAPLVYHISESGFKALPVSILTAFIVGAAITLQGAMQLQSMGVPLVSIEITAKLSLREMGPFILALVIAGRSASSFTAQIGAMQITEEMDAMKTMSFTPFEFLVIPRVLALMIIMPLLVFLADIFALFGGMLAIKYQLGIGFAQYIERFYETVSWTHFWIGMIKAPFFGGAIAMVGCFRGFEVKGNTESVGIKTTVSVVNALFWIIFINAIFSVIWTKLGI